MTRPENDLVIRFTSIGLRQILPLEGLKPGLHGFGAEGLGFPKQRDPLGSTNRNAYDAGPAVAGGPQPPEVPIVDLPVGGWAFAHQPKRTVQSRGWLSFASPVFSLNPPLRRRSPSTVIPFRKTDRTRDRLRRFPLPR